MHIFTDYVLKNYKVSRNSEERFQWSCANELFWVVSLILVKFLSSKRGITPRKKLNQNISCGHALLHIKSFINTKFHEILFSGFRGVALTKTGSSIFNFNQIFKFKKGVIPRKKNWIKISCGFAYLHIMSFITTKFQEILLSGFRGVAQTNRYLVLFFFNFCILLFNLFCFRSWFSLWRFWLL